MPRLVRLVATSLFALAAFSSSAAAQVPLVDGFGGTVGYGNQCLGPNDDGTSRRIDLSSIFPAGLRFFDRTHTSMFVNTNGNITFSDELPDYTPEAFPVAARPMIAPFWADVDIRVLGSAECDDTGGDTGFAGDCENPSRNGVWWHLDTDRRRVVITWDRVNYYSCHDDKVMSFQLILTALGDSECATEGDFDVEFRFNTCEWNTGDASGGSGGLGPAMADCITLPGLGETCLANPGATCTAGRCMANPTPGQAGFDAGNEADFVEIPGSRTNEIHTILCTDSNVAMPGIWRFNIRSGAVVCPDAGDVCETGMLGICGRGRTQCVGGGTACSPEVGATAEICDAVDNDCNGSVDDGDGLCGAGELCDRGVCVGNCFEGGCSGSLACAPTGRCVDPGCEDVTCPAGERCLGGSCFGACDGVICPDSLTCTNGRCVDLCEGATCNSCTTCDEGACIPRCDLVDCPGGMACGDDGACVDIGCEALTCPAGQHCAAGACTDSCAGTNCPTGEICQVGACVPSDTPPPPDGGVGDGGTDGDGGGADGGGTADSGTGRGRSSGCGCRTAGAPSGNSFGWLLVMPALMLWRRRRD